MTARAQAGATQQTPSPGRYFEWQRALSPWLAALIFPAYFLQRHLSDAWRLDSVLGTFAMSLALGALAIGICRRLLSRERASSAATLLILAFFAYPSLHAFAAQWGIRDRFLAPAVLIVLVAVLNWIRRCEPRVALAMVRFAAIFSGLMLSLNLGQLAAQGYAISSSRIVAEMPVEAVAPPTARPPDIYCIVVDGYARSDMLERYGKYDNKPFEEALRSRGFLIPQVRSNYAQTRLSLASMYSLDYLQLSPSPGRLAEADGWVLWSAIRDSNFRKMLEKQGFKSRVIDSSFSPLSRWGYWTHFVDQSLVGAVIRYGFPGQWMDSRPVIEDQLQQLEDAPKDGLPTFTFTHLMLPHPPYLYGRDGRLPADKVIERLNIAQPQAPPELQAYLGQIDFLNRRLLEIIDSIDRKSESPPVILIHADHGSGMLGMVANPNPDQLAERLSIFLALRVPHEARPSHAMGRTLVNHSRGLLREVLGIPLANLPDRSFYSTYENPGVMVEYVPDSDGFATGD